MAAIHPDRVRLKGTYIFFYPDTGFCTCPHHSHQKTSGFRMNVIQTEAGVIIATSKTEWLLCFLEDYLIGGTVVGNNEFSILTGDTFTFKTVSPTSVLISKAAFLFIN